MRFRRGFGNTPNRAAESQWKYRSDIEFAEAGRVSNDLDARDLVPRKGEGQGPGQLAARRKNHFDRSIGECRLDESHVLRESRALRERDELFRPHRGAAELPHHVGGVRSPERYACRAIDAKDSVRIEHGEETLELACARRPQKRLYHLTLTSPARVRWCW